jgi:gamma-glutamyltranspeptidase/glutathione hydrolase
VSLAILGITDRLKMADADDAQTVHRIVEATKRAFALRDAHITDPRHLDVDVQQLLTPEALQPLADSIDDASASPWGGGKGPGDTVWMGVVDNSGWRCRLFRVSITSSAAAWCSRTPGSSGKTAGRPSASTRSISWRWPLANSRSIPSTRRRAPERWPGDGLWLDGRRRSAANSGGAVYPLYPAGVPLQESISRPRWLLGRTWGQSSDSLKLEGRFAPACIARLRELGHDVEVLADFSEAMGHAGAIVRHPNGLLEGATDPRSNGAAAGY